MFLKAQQEFDTPKLTEQFYQGVVIDNNDPKKLRRVKIRIEEIHGTDQEIPDTHIPWSIQFRPTFLGADDNLSSAAVPRLGSQIIVTHVKGDIYSPAYAFELYHQTVRDNKFDQNYPESYGYQDSDGNFWHTDMVDDKLEILFNGSKCLEITLDRDTIIGDKGLATGNDTTTIGQDKTLVVGKDKFDTVDNDETRLIKNNKTETVTNTHTQNATTFTVNTSGDTNLSASGNVVADGTIITLNGAGGGVLTTESINPITGLPYPDGSTTVFAGDG